MRNLAPSRSAPLFLFARNFIKHPRMLGSLVPSSRFLVQRLLQRVDWERARVVVEFGPGVGTFTAEILKRLRPDATLVAIEMNPDFVSYLRRGFDDPRLQVVPGSAAEVGEILAGLGLDGADYVISGIPYSTLPREQRLAILQATRAALHADGALLVYQFSGSVGADLERVFGAVERGLEPLNVPPARWFYCRPPALAFAGLI